MTIDKDTMVYLGSKNGTAYFKIDKCGKLIESMDELDETLLQRKQNNLAKSIADVERIPFTIAKLEGSKAFSNEYKEKKTAFWKHEYNKAKDRISTLKEELANWTHVYDREVFDKYERTEDIPGVSIILYGEESGRYWFYREQFYGKIEEE
jgi:aminoglycoside phosphotransferase (APT) family kinase protein